MEHRTRVAWKYNTPSMRYTHTHKRASEHWHERKKILYAIPFFFSLSLTLSLTQTLSIFLSHSFPHNNFSLFLVPTTSSPPLHSTTTPPTSPLPPLFLCAAKQSDTTPCGRRLRHPATVTRVYRGRPPLLTSATDSAPRRRGRRAHLFRNRPLSKLRRCVTRASYSAHAHKRQSRFFPRVFPKTITKQRAHESFYCCCMFFPPQRFRVLFPVFVLRRASFAVSMAA